MPEIFFRWLQKGRRRGEKLDANRTEETIFRGRDVAEFRRYALDRLRQFPLNGVLELKLQVKVPMRTPDGRPDYLWKCLPPECWPHSLVSVEEMLAMHGEALWNQAIVILEQATKN